MSVGTDRVRVAFNPSQDNLVDQIKQKSAELIDLCTTIPKPEDEKARAEVSRLIALAMTHYEDACMWAVKAATAAPPPDARG